MQDPLQILEDALLEQKKRNKVLENRMASLILILRKQNRRIKGLQISLDYTKTQILQR